MRIIKCSTFILFFFISILSFCQKNDDRIYEVEFIFSNGFLNRNFDKFLTFTYGAGINLSITTANKRYGIYTEWSSEKGTTLCNDIDWGTGKVLCEVNEWEKLQYVNTTVYYEKLLNKFSSGSIRLYKNFGLTPSFFLRNNSTVNNYYTSYTKFNLLMQVGISSNFIINKRYDGVLKLLFIPSITDLRKKGSWSNKLIFCFKYGLRIKK